MLVAQVGLRRLEVAPVGLSLESLGIDGDQVVGDAVASRVAQQRLDDVLALLVATFAVPDRLGRNQWALSGEWTVGPGASVLSGDEGRLAFRFHARDVHLVMGPPSKGAAVPFHVSIDGEPPGEAHGDDVDSQGKGTLTQQRLHQLIRQPGKIEDRTFEITFEAPGAEAYCFTFG